MAERGEIRNREARQQLLDMRELRWGKITPTDIDMFLDFGGEIFVWGEIKYGGTEMPRGQRLAAERINSAAEKAGIDSTFLLISHEHKAPEDIDVANARVVEYYRKNQWHVPLREITVRKAIEKLIGRIV